MEKHISNVFQISRVFLVWKTFRLAHRNFLAGQENYSLTNILFLLVNVKKQSPSRLTCSIL